MCDSPFVLTPQAVWIACNAAWYLQKQIEAWFQYRKRYGLHAILTPHELAIVADEFQYRKRYGLHAIRLLLSMSVSCRLCFNTASGMDCMQ